jgi:hypothetical protein
MGTVSSTDSGSSIVFVVIGESLTDSEGDLLALQALREKDVKKKAKNKHIGLHRLFIVVSSI